MASKIKTRTIQQGERIPFKEYKHQYAIDYLKQLSSNLELEIAQKHRAIGVILQDRALDQTPVEFMGFRIRKMQVELRRVQRSIAFLEKYNKPLKLNIDQLAKSSKKIK